MPDAQAATSHRTSLVGALVRSVTGLSSGVHFNTAFDSVESHLRHHQSLDANDHVLRRQYEGLSVLLQQHSAHAKVEALHTLCAELCTPIDSGAASWEWAPKPPRRAAARTARTAPTAGAGTSAAGAAGCAAASASAASGSVAGRLECRVEVLALLYHLSNGAEMVRSLSPWRGGAPPSLVARQERALRALQASAERQHLYAHDRCDWGFSESEESTSDESEGENEDDHGDDHGDDHQDDHQENHQEDQNADVNKDENADGRPLEGVLTVEGASEAASEADLEPSVPPLAPSPAALNPTQQQRRVRLRLLRSTLFALCGSPASSWQVSRGDSSSPRESREPWRNLGEGGASPADDGASISSEISSELPRCLALGARLSTAGRSDVAHAGCPSAMRHVLQRHQRAASASVAVSAFVDEVLSRPAAPRTLQVDQPLQPI